MKLRVTSIQRGCVNDGPGVRTVVFLKGCVYKCPWCCNPETQSYEEDFFIDEHKCLFRIGIPSELCKRCEVTGGNQIINKCPFGVVVPTSKDYSIEELLTEILKDKVLYRISNGGVTFSGGEPLLQSKELLPLLILLKKHGISIAVETTLNVPFSIINDVICYVDTWCVDLKLQSELRQWHRAIDFIYVNILKIRDNGVEPTFRLVAVDSLLDTKESLIDVLHFLNVDEIELLKCHNLAESKYRRLNMNNINFTISDVRFHSISNYLKGNGIKVRTLKH